jgi:hypothetical protein
MEIIFLLLTQRQSYSSGRFLALLRGISFSGMLWLPLSGKEWVTRVKWWGKKLWRKFGCGNSSDEHLLGIDTLVRVCCGSHPSLPRGKNAIQ